MAERMNGGNHDDVEVSDWVSQSLSPKVLFLTRHFYNNFCHTTTNPSVKYNYTDYSYICQIQLH